MTSPLQILTPFGPGELSITSFTAEESLSTLFHYRLELISEQTSLPFHSILGKGVTLVMPLPDGRDEYLHGIVTRFVHTGSGITHSTYSADLRPEFWLLTLSSNCRIFQNKTTPQIVDEILRETGIADVQTSLTGSYRPREFCVQYRESNFHFLSRLMEEEGIFYFFRHEEGKHTIVFADDPAAYLEYAGLRSIPIRHAGAAWAEEEAILSCSLEEQTVTEKFRTGDYNFEVPETDLTALIGAIASPHEIYDYPADVFTLDDLDTVAKRRLESLAAPRRILRGTSACRSLHPGVKFTLTGHRREEANAEWVIRQVSSHTGPFTNTFEAQPSSVPFRPPRTTPSPRIYGAQTATVVGKAGDRVMADRYGRIRVHFHWDRNGSRNENDSCAIRVAQPSAGKQSGLLFSPQVGQEVVVTFLDGNPDRPLVTGSVHNGAMPAPHDPSSESTVSTIQTPGSNRIRFDDKSGAEEFALRAQKDFKLESLHDMTAEIGNNQTVTVKNQRTVTVQDADENLVVEKGNRSIKVSKGGESHEVKGTRSLSVEGAETHAAKSDYSLTVDGNFTLTVKGGITIQTDAGTIVIKGNSIQNEAKDELSTKAGTIKTEASRTIEEKAGISRTMEGAVSIEIKAPVVKLN